MKWEQHWLILCIYMTFKKYTWEKIVKNNEQYQSKNAYGSFRNWTELESWSWKQTELERWTWKVSNELRWVIRQNVSQPRDMRPSNHPLTFAVFFAMRSNTNSSKCHSLQSTIASDGSQLSSSLNVSSFFCVRLSRTILSPWLLNSVRADVGPTLHDPPCWTS